MARTPENEQDIRNENASAYSDFQNGITQYGNNIGTLERGGSVGADPYQTPAYLANQNRLNADVTSGATSAGKQQLEMENRRSGGQNTGATQADITKLALGGMRMGQQQQTQQKSEDFGKNLQYQQYLAGAPLAASSIAAPVESSTAGDLSQYALAQQKEWYQNIQQMIQAGEAVASAGTGAAGGGGAGGFGGGE